LLFRRENLGQTKSTTINYLKDLRKLFQFILDNYIHTDETFPKGFDLMPCEATVTRIKILASNLTLIYQRKTKQQPGELFVRKTMEADELPKHSEVNKCIQTIESGIPEYLTQLQEMFKDEGRVSVRSEKSGTPAEKRVGVYI